MKRTIIQKDASNIVKGFTERVKNLELKHKLTEGQLKELFLTDVLKLFLSQQFDVGSGIVINHKGEESNQTDVIIYDRRMIPPFIQRGSVGAYPVESVLATIEVKSTLGTSEFRKAEKAARRLVGIYKKCTFFEESAYTPNDPPPPLCAVFGLKLGSPKLLRKDDENARKWLKQSSQNISAICAVGEYSWIKMGPPAYFTMDWKFQRGNKQNHEETKRFIAVILDSVRTMAEQRLGVSTEEHRDWLSQYIRDQRK